jgi:hypothetical protein
MWDNTDEPFQGKPSDGKLQRLTLSLYYGLNVAKGGVFLHCVVGLVAGHSGWTQSQILSTLKNVVFLNSRMDSLSCLTHLPAGRICHLPLTNILDKGYHSILAAWRTGGQLLLQHFFTKSDRKVSSREVLLSGAVASDRSANERAVNRMEASGMIARGIHQCQDLSQAAYLWEAWGFQCNFRFNPVL